MTKKVIINFQRENGNFPGKTSFRNLGPRKNSFRPPKLGARSPPLPLELTSYFEVAVCSLRIPDRWRPQILPYLPWHVWQQHLTGSWWLGYRRRAGGGWCWLWRQEHLYYLKWICIAVNVN